MPPARTRMAAAVAGVLFITGAAAPALAGPDDHGSAGAGDPYFRNYGNGGYDVSHYAIDVTHLVGSHRLQGRTVISARATQDLSRFNLDLGLTASAVTVAGQKARFFQSGQELVITPARPIDRGDRFTVAVDYAGNPEKALGRTLGGWFVTSDGAIAAGEPEVAVVWYPSNDHPSDKARFDITVRTDADKQVISNGKLLGHRQQGSTSVWRWREDSLMATYLATIVIGDYRIVRGKTSSGIPYLYGVSEHLGSLRKPAMSSLRETPRVVEVFRKQFGFYPFSSTGGTLVNAEFGFSLENQTRPNYSKVFFSRGRNTEVIAHELAHMWWGDSISVAQWQDIWLNEGFATWSSWLYADRTGGRSLAARFAREYRSLADFPDFWKLQIGDPGPRRLFDSAVYVRGAMAVQALRERIGTAAHRRLLREWAETHRNGNASIAQFQALAEQISGEDLDTFFTAWLYARTRPEPSAELGFPESMR